MGVLAVGPMLFSIGVAASAQPEAVRPSSPAPGFRIVWPKGDIPPGGDVRVVALGRTPAGLRATVASDPPGRVSLAMRRSRTRRRTVFTARLPRAAGARYRLLVRAGSRRWVRHIATAGVTTVPAPGPGGSAEQPSRPPEPTRPSQCPSPGAAAVELTVQPAVARRGDRLDLTFRNTGEACVTFGAEWVLERRGEDGTWSRAGDSGAVPAWAASLPPGASGSDTAVLDQPDLPPGRYRVVKTFTGPDGPVQAAGELSLTD